MEVPDIRIEEEVQHSEDIKVKEENFSSVVYEVEVISRVDLSDIKPKQENPSQSTPTLAANEEIESELNITVNPDQDPTTTRDELELQADSNKTCNGESESDYHEKHRQPIPQSSQPNPIKSNQKVSKTKTEAVQNQTSQLLQCTLCPQSFSTVELLITHAQTNHSNLEFTSGDNTSSHCPLCSKSFKSVNYLPNHFLRFHVKNKPFQCSACLESTNKIKTFSTESLLKLHMKTVHDTSRYKFQCDICSHKSINSSHHKYHQLTHTKNQYMCGYCSKAYRKKNAMLRHIITVHKEYTDRHETFKCDECEDVFGSKKDLECHDLQIHAGDTVQCKICLKKFKEEGNLSKHLDVAHWENHTWLVCDVCSKVFNNNKDLVEHLEVEHKRFFKCRKCFRSFVSEEDYDGHLTETLDAKGSNVERSQLQCEVCLVFLNSECSFTTHKDTHLKTSEIGSINVLPERFIKCDFCPKTFQQKFLLLEHAMKCHPNEKNWECKSCGKSFRLKYHLNRHELLHSATKPFECKVCKKTFTSVLYLNQHEETHKKNKRYKCRRCKKSFSITSGLRQHIANHHGGEKPFKCDICKKAFALKSALELHSRVHMDKRPFSCSTCSLSFKLAHILRRHEHRMHSQNSRNWYRKGMFHPVLLGPHLKYFENLVYICCQEECDFETKDEKEVAIHNAEHGFPLLNLSKELPCPLSKELVSSKLTPGEKRKQRTVQPRFKCKRCPKMYTTSFGLNRHVKEFHRGSKKKKVVQYPVNHGPQSIIVKSVLFVCSVIGCDFETKDEKEVAIHYAKHYLPTVILPRLLCSPSSQVLLSKSTSTNTHAIQAGYKCTQCVTSFTSPGNLGKHMKKYHADKNHKKETNVLT